MSRWDAARERRKGANHDRDRRTCAQIVADHQTAATAAVGSVETQLSLFDDGAPHG